MHNAEDANATICSPTGLGKSCELLLAVSHDYLSGATDSENRKDRKPDPGPSGFLLSLILNYRIAGLTPVLPFSSRS